MITEAVRRKNVTMADIARETGVSITTVSHVLNRTAAISPETTERVLTAAEQLKYVQRKSGVQTGKKNLPVGILVPDISNEFYSRCVQAICEEAWAHDYTALVCGMRHERQIEAKYIRSLINNGIGGLIFFGGFLDEKYILEASKHVPVVLGDRYLLNHTIPAVITDNTGVMRRLIAKLAKAGYQRIGFISEDLEMTNMKERYMGFRMGIEENGLPVKDEFIITDKRLRLDKLTNASKLMQQLLSEKRRLPEVYVTSSDLIAIGIMAALHGEGFSIPKDIGIVGFDDISFAAHAFPPLTTVAQNMRQLGKSCFAMLMDGIGGGASAGHIVINAKIVVRESVKL
ncbi:MAG: Catabolite control protein A [Firmicutes bacterium ADurb.Bin182]|nr:MAG: Catabolite control protein A [Firmicutes bacterium ADurb.Bin182]